MFYIYYSNSQEIQKDLLLHHLKNPTSVEVFSSETILVQSPIMAQWLNWQIAESLGIASNIKYPMPASFIWQLYVDNLNNVEDQSLFNKENLVWRLMELLPKFIEKSEFASLKYYLHHQHQLTQPKTYQLAMIIADLFDQYLVYRPHWINYFETRQENRIIDEILHNPNNEVHQAQIEQDVIWQGILWRACMEQIAQLTAKQPNHRANLHQQFLQLPSLQLKKIPQRLFIFGISSMPKCYLDLLLKLSEVCDIHLFFTNGCQMYWGDLIDETYWQRVKTRQKIEFLGLQLQQRFTQPQVSELDQRVSTTYAEELANGNPLLASWGKMGRDFLYLLTEMANSNPHLVQEVHAYVESVENTSSSLLEQIKNQILNCDPSQYYSLKLLNNDLSVSLHHCYSLMGEVEALHNYLLYLFNKNPQLKPRDVIVMTPNIDKYVPYIQAVFGKAKELPFAVNDKALTENHILVNFLFQLLNFKENQWLAEDILTMLEIPQVAEQFQIYSEDLEIIHYWVKNAGIRYGLNYEQGSNSYFNSWSAGLKRMLLGISLKEQHGIWEDSLALNSTYGLNSEIVGKLNAFIDALGAWQAILQQPHSIDDWQIHFNQLLTQFFDRSQQSDTWFLLNQTMDKLVSQIKLSSFQGEITIEVLSQALEYLLQPSNNGYFFHLGKINFCTLLPMRSIPFKVICLLGMNDGDYPRIIEQQSFDLMAYHHQKSDRSRRDDDRYLFLEALLACEEYFYLSYVHRNLQDDTPKEPSILVSQFKNYLIDNLGSAEELEKLCFYYPLNPFSASNYQGKIPSFEKKWLQIHHHNYSASKDKLPLKNPLDLNNLIEVKDLISFVADPVSFFCEKTLGINWKIYEDLIPTTENFQLNGLDKYLINQDLLNNQEQIEADLKQKYRKFELQGVLPQANFNQLTAQKLEQELMKFKTKLELFLPANQTPQSLNLKVKLAENLYLQGSVTDLYINPNSQYEMRSYRFSSLKSKDLITSWIKHLMLCATQSNFNQSLYLSSDGGFELAYVEVHQASEQLQTYVKDFMTINQQVILLPNNSLINLLAEFNKAQQNGDSQKFLEKLQGNTQGDFYNTLNLDNHQIKYWQRLAQAFDLEYLQKSSEEYFYRWFELLAQSYQETK